MFSGDRYVRGHVSASGYPIQEGITPSSSTQEREDTFKDLPGFRERVDAVLPVPDSPDGYWVFSELISKALRGAPSPGMITSCQ